MSWTFTDHAARDRLLDAVRSESQRLFEAVDDVGWRAPTACEGWEARDIIGHLVDTTQEYLGGFDAARTGEPVPPPIGLGDMAKHVDAAARSFRGVDRAQLTALLRDDRDRILTVFEDLTAAEWTGMLVPHAYMGPLPAGFYPVFQLVDYAIHTWDVRQPGGGGHGLAGDAADLLVPLIFVLWPATADLSAGGDPYEIGIRVTSGPNACEQRATFSSAGFALEPGPVEDLPAVVEFDPASLVLTAFGRIDGGTSRGDLAVVDRFRRQFFGI